MSAPTPPDDAQQRVEALYRDAGPRVLAYLARRVLPAEDAADLLSEVMVITWRRCADLPDAPDDVPWLFGVARHVLANHRRASQRRDAATLSLARTLARAVASTAGQDVESRLDTRRALDRLGDVDREIVTLSAWEELTSAQVGLVLGLPAATVRTRLARARRRLRLSLDVPEDDGDDASRQRSDGRAEVRSTPPEGLPAARQHAGRAGRTSAR